MQIPLMHHCVAVNTLIFLLLLSTSTMSIASLKDSASIDQNLIAANRHYTQGNLDQAELLYRECLNQDPRQSDCLCNLASLLVDKGYNKEAELYYRRALQVTNSNHAGALYNLALLLQDSQKDGDLVDAKELYLKLIKIEPDNAEAWANLGAVLHQLGDLNLAIPSYVRAIELYSIAGPMDEQRVVLSSLHENVGRATLRLSEQITGDNAKRKDLASKAVAFLEKAIVFNPDNEVASHILRSQQNDINVASAPPNFVKQLFDDYSSSFESSLKSLVYNVPSLIAEAALNTHSKYSLTVDLGCGTGLLGPLLRAHTEHLIGVDLSPKMLAVAEEEKKGIYEHLFAGEMTSLLLTLSDLRFKRGVSNEPVRRKLSGGIIREVDAVLVEGFGGAFLGGSGFESSLPVLVTAADVFVYVGNLQPIFSAFAALAVKGDIFLFTVEEIIEEEEEGENKKIEMKTGGENNARVEGSVSATGEFLPSRSKEANWVLQKTGRFAHSRKYLETLVGSHPSLSIASVKKIVPRMELGREINGLLVTVRCI